MSSPITQIKIIFHTILRKQTSRVHPLINTGSIQIQRIIHPYCNLTLLILTKITITHLARVYTMFNFIRPYRFFFHVDYRCSRMISSIITCHRQLYANMSIWLMSIGRFDKWHHMLICCVEWSQMQFSLILKLHMLYEMCGVRFCMRYALQSTHW